MGSLGTFFAATLVAVTYGWVPASAENQEDSAADAAGYEYLVQVGPEDLRALVEGRVSSLSSATPEGMKSIDRVRIVFGEGELPRQLTAVDRTSPKRIASQNPASQSPEAQRHMVAKPVVSEWLPVRSEVAEKQEGVRHTVYQQPGYQNPGSLGDAMQRGFQEGTRQLTDAVRNAPQNIGNYANQTGRDLADGTRGAVEGAFGGLRNTVEAGANGVGNVANNGLNLGNDPYFNRRQQERNAAAQPNLAGTNQPGYKPYNYNQPQPATQSATQPQYTAQANGDSHAGHDHAGHDHAGHNHPPSTNPDPQTVNNRDNRGPAFPADRGPADTGRNGTDNGIATPFGSGAVDNRTNDRGYDNQNYSRGGYDNRGNENRPTYADPYDNSRLTPVDRSRQDLRGTQNDSFYGGQDATRRGPLDDFSTRREEPRRTEYNDWRTQTVENRPAAPAFGTPTLPPLTQTAGFATPGQNQQGQNQQGASPEVRTWNNGAASPSQNNGQYPPQNGAPTNNANVVAPQNASLGNPMNNLLFSLLLAGSLAGNLYIVTSYLDVRNKYRSALRRGPGGYQNAA